MKTQVTKYAVSVIATIAIASGIVYAADVLTITKTDVAQGDILTPAWVNEVNTKLLALSASAGPSVGTAGDIYCNTIETGESETGYFAMDLNIGGRNICADKNGCTYRVWRMMGGAPNEFYTTYPIAFLQMADGHWHDAKGNNVGTNGDSVQTVMIIADAHFQIYDDHAGTENDPNKLTFRDEVASKAYRFTVCDF